MYLYVCIYDITRLSFLLLILIIAVRNYPYSKKYSTLFLLLFLLGERKIKNDIKEPKNSYFNAVANCYVWPLNFKYESRSAQIFTYDKVADPLVHPVLGRVLDVVLVRGQGDLVGRARSILCM